MNEVLEKCPTCGDSMYVPKTWMGIYPPKPHCQRCQYLDSKKEYQKIVDTSGKSS